MTKSRLALCAAAAIAVFAAAPAHAGDLIANGDFETGSLAPWGVSGVIADVTEGDYGPCCGFFTSHPTNHVAAFGGGFGSGTEVLTQSFNTTAGQQYSLTYDWAFIGGGFNTLDVTVGGLTHHFEGGGSSNIDASYAHDVLSFLGSGGVDTVSFTVGDSPRDSTDTIVDNVSIAVPEPASWALMITGFGLTGAALRRRRQMAPARA